ncbi:MAG: enoyl-CoA hydratase-related protein [Porticoccaceae bacterium]
MSEQPIILQTEGPVASITFNRPDKANAMLVAWPDQMTAFFHQVEADPNVRCIHISGRGKNFMAGGDLEQFGDITKMSAAEKSFAFERDVYTWNKLITAMRRCPKPIVVSIQGAVAGAAVGLVAASDLIVATKSSFLFLAHIFSGMSNDGMATYFLPRQIGVHKTLQLALLGDRLGAEQAQQMGLVNFVVEDDALEAETQKILDRLAKGPTAAYGLIKNLVRSSLENSMEEQGRLEAESIGKCVQTHDWQEGVTAFVEKRKPAFTGN